MKKIKMISTIVILMSGLVMSHAYSAATQSTPVGYWKTIDDISGKPRSIIKIWETQDHLLMGQVTKIFPAPGRTQEPICLACNGDKHNQPIVGMVILSGLKAAEHQWGHGKILDPQNGKTYSCSAKLADQGKKLDVRGYIGLPLLGRSQTWERVDVMSAS